VVGISVLASSQVPAITRESTGKRPSWLGGVSFALGVYALTRLFAFAVVVFAGRHQISTPASVLAIHRSISTTAAPGYWTIVTNWDGQWYRDIATHGYPGFLPQDPTGLMVQNVWGFYPLYPLLVGGLMWATGVSFTVVGPTVSIVLGAAAVVVLFRLVHDALGTKAATIATLLTCTFMSAPVLQAADTESLALLLLCSCLLLLRRRRYAWAALAILLLALTRNVVLAMAPVILLHGLVRWRSRADDDFTRRDQLRVGALAALCVAATGLWPAIAALATGDPSAYMRTMGAWGGGPGSLLAWPRAFLATAGPAGLLVLFLGLFVLVGLLARPDSRRWGPELWGWAVAYPCYLFVAAGFGSSTPRHWLLAFPLSLLVVDLFRVLPGRVLRACLLGATVLSGLALQWIWIANVLVITKLPQPFP
jgi:hypothetical protein